MYQCKVLSPNYLHYEKHNIALLHSGLAQLSETPYSYSFVKCKYAQNPLQVAYFYFIVLLTFD